MNPPLRKGRVALLVAVTLIFALAYARAQESTDAARKVVLKTQAAYPTLAQSMNIRGVVKLEVRVAPNGIVKSVDVKGGHPILTQSAVTAVGHWKFEPASHETRELVEIKFDPQ
jgi:TonB family protein